MGPGISITDEGLLLATKPEMYLRVPITEWDLLREKVDKMPESSEWARSLMWTSIGVFVGTLVVLIGWLQVWNGMTEAVRKDNQIFWVVYGVIAIGSLLAAFVGYKLDGTVRSYQRWSRTQICEDMDHIRSRHDVPISGASA